MNTKIAAVLLAATIMATPAFAAGVANSPNAPTATPHKITKIVGEGREETPGSCARVVWSQGSSR